METVIDHTWPWPLWTAALGLLVLLTAVLLLFRREPPVNGRGRRLAIRAARLAACGVLVWMIAGWQRQQHRTEPAQLVVAVDDSASMSFADPYREAQVLSKARTLSSNSPTGTKTSSSSPSRFDLCRALLTSPRSGWLPWLEKNYRLKLRKIGETVREISPTDSLLQVQPTQAGSRLGQSVRDLLAAQQGIPTAALVLFTDGVTTSGPKLVEAAETARRQGIPLYLVGVGGNQAPNDLRLVDLVADDVAFAGDVVQVEAQVLGEGFAGQKSTARIRRADTGEVLAEQAITIEKEPTRQPIRLSFRPQSVGTLPLIVEVLPLRGESDTANNRLAHTLHVNDVAIQVLYVQAYPSYEFRFLKNLLSRATRASDPSVKAFDLTTVLQEADREHADQDESAASLFPVTRDELDAFDVVLFGDVDPTLLGRAAIDNLVTFVRERGGSIVFLAGPRFTPNAYRETRLAELFPFPASAPMVSADLPATEPFAPRLTPLGALYPACRLEASSAENQAVWNALPELFWYLSLPTPHAGARVLLEHPTRRTAEGRPSPLVLTHYANSGQVTFQATDETYRWARFRGSDEYYSRYWLQTLRSLSRPKLLVGQSLAEVTTDRQQYLPTDEVQLRVRFRGDRTNLTEVMVALEQPNGSRQSVVLRRTDVNAAWFTAHVRDLPPGSYRAALATPILDPAPTPRSFTISPPAQERIGAPIDVVEMQQAAQISGGRYYPWFQADRLLRDLPRGQRVRIESLPPEPIWNSPWVAGLFVTLLTVEWLLRKGT